MTSTCGGTLNGPVGSFTSPNYPSDYCNNQNCYYNITVEEGYTMMVIFTTLHLEIDSDEAIDYVKVYTLINALEREEIVYLNVGLTIDYIVSSIKAFIRGKRTIIQVNKHKYISDKNTFEIEDLIDYRQIEDVEEFLVQLKRVSCRQENMGTTE
ncbi:CUBN [Mytilus coruscus]|uniref:CUBN n=1 Tax=Mytilus coruscus TaxID=42192 RepID=A0A6J8CKB5_MYTCO|nr:CUBN [Mytilus coruscus]